MKNKKLFAILTLVCFLFTLMPVAAFAENSANITPNFTGNNKVYNETTGVYYEDLAAAVNATTGAAVLYCKADADVSGSNFTHISVHYDLTIYGNGAKITNGEHDLAIDTYDKNGKSAGLERDVTIKVYELNGIALWGQRQTEYTVNAYFENCKDMNRIYISGKKGTNNIELVNCTFTGEKCAIYSNAKGEIKISGCTFTNVQEPINLNNKSADKQKITVSNCTFDTCGSTNDVDKDYAAPIRVLATTEGGTSELNVNSCTFTNTAGNNGDILLGEGRTGKDAKGIVKADVADTNAIVEMQKPGDANKTDNAQIEVTKDETTKLTSVVAKIGDREYATWEAAIADAQDGDTVENLETGRTYIKKGTDLVAIYTVTFDSNGGSEVVAQDVENGSYATKPADPTKSGYRFVDWYADENCTGSAYSFDTAVTEDTTLYAKWNKKSTSSYSSGSSATVTIDAEKNVTVKVSDKYAKKGDTVTITVDAKDGYYPESIVVKDKNGNEITVTRTGLNEYQFTMPSGKVNIDVDMKAYTSQVVLQIGNTNVVNNGTTVNNDVAPFIQDGRTMVPIRVIVEQLGGVAAWDEATRTVTLTIDGKVLTMVIDEVIPGFDTAATIVDGRTYVPIRYISEAIGANVEWIAATNQIVIVK